MDNQNEIPDEARDSNYSEGLPYDYSNVVNPVRIAVYDDGHSIPRMVVVPPADTATFIENLSQTVYNEARNAGGSLPYMAIREVSENFIHARFAEATVSILDRGNTVRFTDQGPGIPDKERAQQPGFTRAIEPMKPYIRGVGSGLPIVREYMELSRGRVTIEDNLGTGAVVTISLVQDGAVSGEPSSPLATRPAETGGEVSIYGVSSGPSIAYFPNGSGTASVGSGAPQAGSASFVPAQVSQPAAPGVYPQPAVGYEPSSPYMASMAPAPVYVAPQATYPYTQQVPTAQYVPGQPVQQPVPASPSVASGVLVGQSHGRGYSVDIPELTQRELDAMAIMYQQGPIRGSQLGKILNLASSSTSAVFEKLEAKGLVMKYDDKKRGLTEIGNIIASRTI